MLASIGRVLAGYLAQPGSAPTTGANCAPAVLSACIRKGDVLLVDGSSRISTAIKYLTQSTWSHAALCINTIDQESHNGTQSVELIEADVQEGIRVISLSAYCHQNTRICRPVGLSEDEIDRIVKYATSRAGHQYDLKNIFDLARYLVQTPPVPTRWRRQMLALGSGDPTRAICSSLIAQAFQSVRYPILPIRYLATDNDDQDIARERELLHIRHHSLFAPRDFDISPYFEIIKPSLLSSFDPHKLEWIDNFS